MGAVLVRQPSKLLLRRTFTQAQLKGAGENSGVDICWMTLAPGGDKLLFADYENDSVKALQLASGGITSLYKETKWRMGMGALMVGPGAAQRLFVAESNPEYSVAKRVVVADMDGNSGNFSETYVIPFEDEEGVRSRRTECELVSIILPGKSYFQQ